MSLSMRAVPVAPQAIAGGFVLVPVREILSTWRKCRSRPIGVGDFRTWLACREMVARRCSLGDGRSPTYGLAELARLTGVSQKRARASVNRLAAAGHLVWSDQVIGFPDTGDPDDALVDSIGGGNGSLAIPRRMLRLLAGGARPALIATVLAVLLRCLSRGRGGFKSRGRVKASWVARVFDVDLRRVKQARKDLIALGWLVPEAADQWSMNRWGATYHIDLGWDRTPATEGPRLPPPLAEGGRRLPPPDLHPEPLREDKNQEPASGGPPGVEVKGTEGRPIPPPPLVDAARSTREERGQETNPGRPSGIPDGAGETLLPAPTLNDVRVEDLKDIGRLLELLDQAIARNLVGSSEADRLKFVAAAEHARAVGTVNPCGLFAILVRSGWWHFVTQADEAAASRRLKRHLFGVPREVAGVCGSSSPVGRPRLSSDAMLVREVKAATSRAGYRGDPFTLVRARDGSWTRERWDAALLELKMSRHGT